MHKPKSKPKKPSPVLLKALDAVAAVGADKALRDTKQAQIVKLLQRPQGATMEDMQAATGWQKHTIRSVLSRIVTKKLGYKITSSQNDNGLRVFTINDTKQ